MAICYHHLAKRTITNSYCFYSSPRYQNLSLLAPLLQSSLSTQTQTQHRKELPFIAQYLISSFGFSPDRALKYSANSHLAPIKSPARPEAVIKFLTDTGLTDAQIKAAVSLQPIILAYSVDKNFEPKVRELINGGFSRELLVQLIRYSPTLLYRNGNLSRLRFWRDFVGRDEEVLSKIISKNPILFTLGVDKQIVPVITLLKDYGLSKPDILILLQQGTRCMGQNLNSLRCLLQLVEELGILRGSTMFRYALRVVGGICEDKIRSKAEFFKKTYGWSQEDVNMAFRKYPTVLSYSENKVKSNMGFLLEKARFEPRSLASNPVLIGLSLERVLIPRYDVLLALEAKGLKIKCSLSTVFMMSKRSFHKRYVLPFEKDLPGFANACEAA